MYSVIVVDDEPAAVEHVCAIIDKKCPNFKVIATAYNGMECLELIKVTKPDMVISDVKMPIMDGIELIKKLSEDYPDIITLIVSGYQEFEYAKGALKYRAVDYIQKPILPSAMRDTLEAMGNRLCERFFEERKKIIRDITRDINVEEAILKKYFPTERYYAFIIRKNGLLRRFKGTSEIEIFSDFHESIIVYGRDEMESLYLIPYNILFNQDKESIQNYIEKLIKKENANAYYITTIASVTPFEVISIGTIIKSLYQALDKASTIGLNQLLFLEEIHSKKREVLDDLKGLKKLDYYISSQQRDKAKQELKRLFELWEKNNLPQLQVEGKVWQTIYSLMGYGGLASSNIGIEYQMEDAFYYAPDMKALYSSLEAILFSEEETDSILKGKIDTPEFFTILKNYMKNNIAQPLTLQSVSKEFGISQTYLSKLFRKYEEKSFNNYLTYIRMEQAKELMKNDTNMYIKDLATMVGFNDQFYFSRIFHSYTGICPSDYIKSVSE